MRPRRRRGPCADIDLTAGSSPSRIVANPGLTPSETSDRARLLDPQTQTGGKGLAVDPLCLGGLYSVRCPRTHSAIRWRGMEARRICRSSCCARPPLTTRTRLGQPPGLGEQCHNSFICSAILRRAVTARLEPALEGEFQRRPAGTRLCAQAYRHSPGRATQEGRIAGSGDVAAGVSAAEQARDTPTTGCQEKRPSSRMTGEISTPPRLAAHAAAAAAMLGDAIKKVDHEPDKLIAVLTTPKATSSS